MKKPSILSLKCGRSVAGLCLAALGATSTFAQLFPVTPRGFPVQGLAARYPGDAGIERDPRVVFVEDFEELSLDALWQRWETVGDKPGQTFSDDAPPGSAGKRSLIMERQQGPGAQLYRRLKNKDGGWGYDRLFARYYVKFDPDCGEIHHFGPCLGGNLPATRWPSVKAGQPTDGAKSFWSGIEPFGSSWTWDYYTYWCDMRGSPPRGQTWGNSFIRDPGLKVAKGRWICVEQMIQMNDVGDTNGEQALWIDGKQISYLGKGFPKGVWTYDKFTPGKGGNGIRWNQEKGGPERFTVPEGGVPFEGFRWRTVKDLNVNYLWLYLYTQKPAGHRIKVWFDHVVVATDYIGRSWPKPRSSRRTAAHCCANPSVGNAFSSRAGDWCLCPRRLSAKAGMSFSPGWLAVLRLASARAHRDEVARREALPAKTGSALENKACAPPPLPATSRAQ